MRPVAEAGSKYDGVRYGKIVVVQVVRRKDSRAYVAKIRCDCGTEKTVSLSLVRRGIKSCGCSAWDAFKTVELLGGRYSIREFARLVGIDDRAIGKRLMNGQTPDNIFRELNPYGLIKLRLTKTKKRGRPIKTLEGREISHEELLRGLVRHQAIAEAS